MPFGNVVSTTHWVEQTENAAKRHRESKRKDDNLAQKRSSGKVKGLLNCPAWKEGAKNCLFLFVSLYGQVQVSANIQDCINEIHSAE